MNNWQVDVRGVFDKVINFVKDSYTFTAGTYSANQVKAGLYAFSYETNLLLDGHDHTRAAERSTFLAKANIHDGMGQDELFDIMEKLEFHMHKKFQTGYIQPSLLSDRAYVKAKFIANNIADMSEARIEDYAHKFDRMIGIYTGPTHMVNKSL